MEYRPEAQVASGGANASLKSFLKQKEKEYIEQILSTTGGDKEKAAETLKVNLSTLYRKLSRLREKHSQKRENPDGWRFKLYESKRSGFYGMLPHFATLRYVGTHYA